MIHYILLFIILTSLSFTENSFQDEQIQSLKIKHENLLDLFGDIKEWNYLNHSNYLSTDKLKEEFYDILDIFNLTLSIALSNPDFMLTTSEKLINTYKNDSKYFSGLKSYINKDNNISIVNTYSYEEQNEYSINNDSVPLNDFIGKHILYFKYGQMNKFGSSTTSDSYGFGNSFDIMFYSPKEIKFFNLNFLLSYNISYGILPSTTLGGEDLEIQKINLHLIKFLNKIPLYFDIGVGPMLNNKDLGINFEFTLSYYIPIKAVDLAFNLSYEQYLDIKEDFNFIFGEQDLIGINITVGKSLIIK